MREEAKRVGTVIDRHHQDIAARQCASVIDRESAAAEDAGATVNPHHDKEPGCALKTRAEDVQMQTVLVEPARIAAIFR